MPGATLVGVRFAAQARRCCCCTAGRASRATSSTRLVDELEDGYRVAWYQQRGVPPSTPVGPYDIGTAAADAVAVPTRSAGSAVVGGFSHGGTCMHLVVDHPDRLGRGGDRPDGATGDGGEEVVSAPDSARLRPERVAAMEGVRRAARARARSTTGGRRSRTTGLATCRA